MSEPKIPKIIAVDCNFLVAAQSDKTSEDDVARIELLFSSIDRQKSKLVIPMPVLAEYLVGADVAGYDWVNVLSKKSSVILAPFDLAAARENALLDRAAFQSGNKRDGRKDPWQKIKIDRQIVAIAKSVGAELLITEDDELRADAARMFVECKSISELYLPPTAKQMSLDYSVPPTVDGAGMPRLSGEAPTKP